MFLSFTFTLNFLFIKSYYHTGCHARTIYSMPRNLRGKHVICMPFCSRTDTHTPIYYIYNIYANHKRKQRKLKSLKRKKKKQEVKESPPLNIYQICTQMGWSESQQGCKKHPDEKQLPGVCPSCLRERLSQIQGHSINKRTYVGDSSSPSSVASSSTFVSPVYLRHHRRLSERSGSISFTLSVSQGLKKSRSIAFVTRNRAEEFAGSLKKKGGFWSKLLKSTGKRTKEAFMQPRIGSQRLE